MRRISIWENVSGEIGFYNLDNNRADLQVKRELRAILGRGLFVLGIVEAIGNTLPDVKGYRLIADRSTRSRANIAAYVEEGRRVTNMEWIDLELTWPRTQGPGRHEPRSVLSFFVDGIHVIVGHQAPRSAGDRVQAEGIDAFAKLMNARPPLRRVRRRVIARWRPRLCLADFNKRKGEPGPGPSSLARRVRGYVLSGRIDTAVYRMMKLGRAIYSVRVAGVKLESDHQHVLFFTFRARVPRLRRV